MVADGIKRVMVSLEEPISNTSTMHQTTDLILSLPDLFSLTPFSWAGCNPHYSLSKRESTEWILSYGLFSDSKRSRFMETRTELLGAYTYPFVDAKGLRIANDWLTMLATLDQFTDDQDGSGARATSEIFIKALNGDADNASPIASFTKDFLGRLSGVPDDLLKRFVAHLTNYIRATTEEANLRAKREFPSFEEYMAIRRDNGGLIPCCDVLEIVSGITLPPEVHEDHNFQSIVIAAVDMMSLSNDIYSYAMEHASGIDGCNAITVLMQSKGLSHQESMDHTADLYKSCAATIVASKAAIRSFGSDVDEMIRAYVHGLEQAICGNNEWSLDTPRYFGDLREEVRRTGVIRVRQH